MPGHGMSGRHVDQYWQAWNTMQGLLVAAMCQPQLNPSRLQTRMQLNASSNGSDGLGQTYQRCHLVLHCAHWASGPKQHLTPGLLPLPLTPPHPWQLGLALLAAADEDKQERGCVSGGLAPGAGAAYSGGTACWTVHGPRAPRCHVDGHLQGIVAHPCCTAYCLASPYAHPTVTLQ